MFFEQIMTPSRNINNKKQSADYRRSDKSQYFKIKRCLIRIKKFKDQNFNMRKVNNIEQKRTIPPNKRLNPIERKSEIRIIKSVSNVTKPINKTVEKVRNNASVAIKQKFNESSDEEIPKVSNNFKQLPIQNVKQVARPVGRPPANKKLYEKKVLEKQQQQQQQPKQQIQQPQPAIKKVIESKVVEDTPTRSKRTPKPNRRYLNDSLITSFKSDKILRKINGDVSDSESETDQFNASSSDVDSDILRESDDSSSAGEEFDIPSRTKIKPNVLNVAKKTPDISATMKQKLLNDSIEKNKINLFNKMNQAQKNSAMFKQVSMPGKTIILNKYSYSQASGNQSSSLSTKPQLVKPIDRSQKPKQILPISANNNNLIRKRKLNEPIQQQRELIKVPKISEKSSVKSDFFSDIDFNDDDDADNTDIEDFIKELTQQKQIKVVKKFSQQLNKPPLSQENRNISLLTKKPTILNKAVQQQPKEKENAIDSKKSNNAQQSLKKILNKDYESENESLDSFAESDKEVSQVNENPIKKADSSNLEDFEKMPTFTIVNINDIIGKKGDFLLEKQKNDPLNSENTCGSPDSSEENSVSAKSKNNLLASGSATQRNRRKAMHTNLLSENLDKNKDPPPRTPFPPQRKNAINNKSGQLKGSPSENVKLLNNNLKLSKSVSTNRRTLSQKSPNKGPPRILNSMVAKKTPPITTFNTKVDTRRSQDLSDSDIETKLLTNRGRTSKENILKQQLLKQINENKLDNQQQQQQRSSAQPSSTISGNKRKLPSEKVIIQRQGNKIIKKITCFETWYVINLPPETVEKENTNSIIRNSIDIPLIQLANHAKQIDLPNKKWTCKVSLQKCTATMITQNSEPYTGEIYDDYINPDELHKYRPTNVMFRRQALHPTPKVPYDRAVIFKNNTFFTNIEGKNVKLIGAPHQIEQLKDIEILLNLVDDFSLKNQFVEQAPYVP